MCDSIDLEITRPLLIQKEMHVHPRTNTDAHATIFSGPLQKVGSSLPVVACKNTPTPLSCRCWREVWMRGVGLWPFFIGRGIGLSPEKVR